MTKFCSCCCIQCFVVIPQVRVVFECLLEECKDWLFKNTCMICKQVQAHGILTRGVKRAHYCFQQIE
jgi:hypothetical protein